VRETRAATLSRALELARDDARERWGDDPARWEYGDVHAWKPSNPMGGVPVLGRFFDRDLRGVPGSDTSPCVFTGGWRDGVARIDVRHGASLRFVADCADPDRSLAILPGGQSGHPFDERYDDQLERYLGGALRPMRWSEAAIESATRTRLTLAP
jgi:penicillin amidase